MNLAAQTEGQITEGLEGQAGTFMSWWWWEGPEEAMSDSHLGKVAMVGKVGDKSVPGRAEHEAGDNGEKGEHTGVRALWMQK